MVIWAAATLGAGVERTVVTAAATLLKIMVGVLDNFSRRALVLQFQNVDRLADALPPPLVSFEYP